MSESGKMSTTMLTKPPVLHKFPLITPLKHAQDYEDDYDMDLLIAQGRFIAQAQNLRD